MQAFPHVYTVRSSGAAAGLVSLDASGAPEILAAAPPEFDGPEHQWSPESLFAASLASCFILTFRAMARASKLPWSRVECSVEATLERVDGVPRFTKVVTHATLTAPDTVNEELCHRVLEKAEKGCLVANSITAQRELRAQLVLND